MSEPYPEHLRRPLGRCRWPAVQAAPILVLGATILCATNAAADEAQPAETGASPTAAATESAPEQAKIQAKLDEVEAQKGVLELQLKLLDRKQTDLEARAAEIAPLQQQLSAAQAARERAENEAVELRGEIEQLQQQRQGEAQKHTAQLTAAELRLREHKDRLGGVDAQIQRLEQQLAQREAQIERLQAAERRRAEARVELEKRLDELRARLPAPEGGTVTAAEARSRAREDAETLERLIREGQGINNPRLWRQIRETENALHSNQYLLARAEGDRTVYRVRPGDSLERISAILYGDNEAWPQIFEANRHLLDDPERVLPGLTLVIP